MAKILWWTTTVSFVVSVLSFATACAKWMIADDAKRRAEGAFIDEITRLEAFARSRGLTFDDVNRSPIDPRENNQNLRGWDRSPGARPEGAILPELWNERNLDSLDVPLGWMTWSTSNDDPPYSDVTPAHRAKIDAERRRRDSDLLHAIENASVEERDQLARYHIKLRNYEAANDYSEVARFQDARFRRMATVSTGRAAEFALLSLVPLAIGIFAWGVRVSTVPIYKYVVRPLMVVFLRKGHLVAEAVRVEARSIDSDARGTADATLGERCTPSNSTRAS